MKRFFTPRVQGALRHALTSIGPIVAYLGVAEDATWQIWVGAVMAFIGFAGSWFAPEKKQ